MSQKLFLWIILILLALFVIFVIAKKQKKAQNIWSGVVFLLAVVFIVFGFVLIYYGTIFSSGYFSLESAAIQTFSNFGTGLIDTAITILVIDNIYKFRERQSLFVQLIRLLRSSDNLTAMQSLEDLHANKFLKKTVLQNLNLSGANLEGTQLLSELDMTGCKFSRANLRNTNFHNSILDRATLLNADLSGADLIATSLNGANLIKANLQNAIFQGVNLKGALLNGANLTYATFQDVILDVETILPDGTNWNEKERLSKFTDPNDPSYWKPGN